MGRYKKELNIICKAAFLECCLNSLSVGIRNKIPQILTITAETIPAILNQKGSSPRGINNKVYTTICIADWLFFPPFEGSILKPAF